MQDVRHAIRMLLKSPGFTLVSVLSIALAVGANATVFTWLKSVLLDPLPGVARSGELLTMNASLAKSSGLSNSYQEYVNFREHSSAFSGLVAHELVLLNLSSREKPQMVVGGIVSSNYFDVLGVKMALGRGFTTDENAAPEAHPVAVLNYELWDRDFSRDPAIAGKTVLLNGRRFTVIGVAAPAFGGVYGGLRQDVWIPLMMSKAAGHADRPDQAPVQIMGRLRPGATRETAQAEMHVLAKQYSAATPGRGAGWDEMVYPLYRAQRGIQSSIVPFLWVLLAVAGFILLIACANVANLLLARSTVRAREIAVRLALGASRYRLVRQLVTESLLLALLGGFLGVMLAFWTADTLPALLPSLGGLRLNLNLAVDLRVLAFSFVVVGFTALAFGLIPALRASKPGLAGVLQEGSRSSTPDRATSYLRGGLVVAQFVLSLIALVGAGLFGRSLEAALLANPGFDAHQVMLASVNPFLNGYDRQRGIEFYRQLIQDLEKSPRITSASLTSFVPLRQDGGGNSTRVAVEGYAPSPGESMAIVTDSVGPRFLETLRIPVLEGRDLGARDTANAPPVVMVNQTFAHRYWPGQTAIGRRIQLGGTWREVVGVFRDFKYRTLDEEPAPHIYVPLFQRYQPDMILMVRTDGDPVAALPSMQAAVKRLDPNVPLSRVETFEHSVGNSQGMQSMVLKLLAVFAGIALTLTAVGIYGVVSYSVAQRTREFGIRLALGAREANVLGMVLWQGLGLAVVGIVIGLAAAMALAQVAASLLYGVSPRDVVTLGAASLLLFLIAAVACYVPARRATRVDPMEALRYE